MAWWNMRRWKKILRNILMLWYSKKGVLMLMLTRKAINHSKVVVNAGIGQMSLHNLRKHMVRLKVVDWKERQEFLAGWNVKSIRRLRIFDWSFKFCKRLKGFDWK
jgi:hypothetical protein